MCHIVRDLFFAILYVCPYIVIQQRLNDGFFKKIILKYPAVQIPYIIIIMTKCMGTYKGLRWNHFSPYPHLEARWRGVSPLLFWAFISIHVLTLSANSKAFTHCQQTSKCA